MTAQDPIHRLAAELTSIQNQPSAQQKLTIRPVISSTRTFDGKNEQFEHFEDLIYTMIIMQPEKSEQMKIIHFHHNSAKSFSNNSKHQH